MQGGCEITGYMVFWKKKGGIWLKKFSFRLIALVVAVVLLSGCAQLKNTSGFSRDWETRYSDMVYTRPDMVRMQQILDDALLAAEGDGFSIILDSIYTFNEFYDDFYTNYSLADIKYSADLTDLYWEDEYDFCAGSSPEVEAALEELYRGLAQSPCREELESEDYFGADFFDAYEGDSVWDESFAALMDREAELQNRYYELSNEAMEYELGTAEYYDACGGEMVNLLVELIALRQQIAACWGYDSYPEFASDFYHYRDYTMAESERYLEQIRQELVGLYMEICESQRWETGKGLCTEADTFAYVRNVASAMGGDVWQAFRLMDRAGLYDIAYGENKYPSSFSVYLTSYWEPFIFMNPSLTAWDKLTFAHEFGHFCNDYLSYGSYVGTDVAEIFSQGMEYLSLCYAENAEELVWLKMADSLCLMVEQAAFASFEQQMYSLQGEDLTEETLRQLYAAVVEEYGFDSLGFCDWDFVTINHYYTNPMYIISYVVSNDAALQLYQMEQEEPGKGLPCYQENLDTEEVNLLEFLSSAGLKSPFEPGRAAEIRLTLEQMLK